MALNRTELKEGVLELGNFVRPIFLIGTVWNSGIGAFFLDQYMERVTEQGISPFSYQAIESEGTLVKYGLGLLVLGGICLSTYISLIRTESKRSRQQPQLTHFNFKNFTIF